MSKKPKRTRVKRQPVATIRKWNDPILSTVCRPVEPHEAKCHIHTMIRTLKRSVTGVGLAAPQVGLAMQIILVWPKRCGDVRVMVNPQIVETSTVYLTTREGCLSYPGVQADIRRPLGVMVEFDTLNSWGRFDRSACWFWDYEARIIQHEIDHLNGICKVGDAWRSRRHAMHQLGPSAPETGGAA